MSGSIPDHHTEHSVKMSASDVSWDPQRWKNLLNTSLAGDYHERLAARDFQESTESLRGAQSTYGQAASLRRVPFCNSACGGVLF